eukprot:TRINITY_DN4346_c0_g1_i8.p1 TRINITY_DN4346_c0_g1~~TRINITY_DN4346_c0_g1_i8.p1  ORF type:complete len:1156 (+),score=150.78 TRINITY_DN4346_c0_g1_i8:1073-4540(+)
MLFGNMMHEVFERCLKGGTWEPERLEQEMQAAIQSSQQDLYGANISPSECFEDMKRNISDFVDWAAAEVHSAITGVMATEENVWSPQFGLKGKVDATITLRGHGQTPIPLEFKTGKGSEHGRPIHRAQALLYTLLLSERYDTDVSTGALLYVSKKQGPAPKKQTSPCTIVIESKRLEIIELLKHRNVVAAHISRWMLGVRDREGLGETSAHRNYSSIACKENNGTCSRQHDGGTGMACTRLPLERSTTTAGEIQWTGGHRTALHLQDSHQGVRSHQRVNSHRSAQWEASSAQRKGQHMLGASVARSASVPESQMRGGRERLRVDRRLPPMLASPRDCGFCNQKEACALYHKSAERRGLEEKLKKPMLDNLEPLRDVSDGALEYFEHWDALLDLEAAEIQRVRHRTWTMAGAVREALGACLNALELVRTTTSDERPQLTTQTLSAASTHSSASPHSLATPPTPDDTHAPPATLATAHQTSASASASADPCPSEPTSAEPRPLPRSFFYRFKRAAGCEKAHSGRHLYEVGLGRGDFVSISVEKTERTPGGVALGQGFIHTISKHEVTVVCTNELQSPVVWSSASDDVEDLCGGGTRTAAVVWRIDREESASTHGVVKDNLRRFVTATTIEDIVRRRVLIDNKAPIYDSGNTLAQLEAVKRVLNSNGISHEQRRALEIMLSARDYAILQGMPGTGKTTTTAHLVVALMQAGKRVLITAYTHSAVDNMLAKVVQLHSTLIERRRCTPLATSSSASHHSSTGPFVRIGHKRQIHPDMREHAVPDFPNVESLRDFLEAKRVFASTVLSVSSPLFAHINPFDVCVVDEASQLTEPACLLPIRMAHVFLLVGDHKQLPPLVKNEEAKASGLERSLFARLAETYPKRVVQLTEQYRMNKEIMNIASEVVYENMLKCGSTTVAEARLSLPNLALLPPPMNGEPWLKRILDPSHAAVFVDTDGMSTGSPHFEEKHNDAIVNETEANLVGLIAAYLHRHCEIALANIGVISPYRAQLGRIRAWLRDVKLISRAHSGSTRSNRSRGGTKAAEADEAPEVVEDVEVGTVDRFQGRDKEVILLSCVRSNSSGSIGDLLRDRRRVNVAITRAKTKLILVGSRSTLLRDPLLKEVMKRMFVYRLGVHALAAYPRPSPDYKPPYPPAHAHPTS